MPDLYDESRWGDYAAELLTNPVFDKIWTDLEANIVRELKQSSPRDAEGREKAVLMLQLLAKLKRMVEETAHTGKLAKMMLERKSALQTAKEWITRDGLIESR